MILVKHEIQCNIPGCGEKHFQEYLWYSGQIPVTPREPEGWTMIGNVNICQRHKIKVLVDGQELAQ